MDLREWMFLLTWIKKSNVIEKTLENQKKKKYEHCQQVYLHCNIPTTFQENWGTYSLNHKKMLTISNQMIQYSGMIFFDLLG